MSMKKLIAIVAVLLVAVIFAGFAGLPDAAGQGKGKAKAAAATFEVYKDNAGEFRFRLVNGEGELMAASGKGYKTKAECQRMIDAIKQDAPKARVDDQSK
jgi:uncharacterized protein YegP (UPF0339 family)